MRIIYVTANLPHGTDEAFLLPEIAALRQLGHDVLVVPRSPVGDIVHGGELLPFSEREGLLSGRVLLRAAAAASAQLGKLKTALKSLGVNMPPRLALKNLTVIPKAAWLSTLAVQWGADHIHCHWAGTTATMAMIASKLSGVPWSLTLHRWDIVENNLLAVKASSASMVRFISQDGREMGRDRGIPESDHIRVIHMGVPIPLAAAYGSSARSIVLCPARLVEVKGHRFVLEAWRILRDRGIEAELWLAGDGPLRTPLEKLATSLDILPSVRFLGAIPHARLMEIYEALGIVAVVLPSLDLGGGCHEGIPVALIEAMSYGVPVVATRAGGTRELVPGGTGLLVRPGDSGELAAALQSVLEDRAGAQRLGERGRCHVAKEFDIRNIASELVAAFEATKLGGQPARAAFAARGN